MALVGGGEGGDLSQRGGQFASVFRVYNADGLGAGYHDYWYHGLGYLVWCLSFLGQLVV